MDKLKFKTFTWPTNPETYREEWIREALYEKNDDGDSVFDCMGTRRVAERHLRVDGSVHYDILQKTFMDALPPDTAIFNEYHALIFALCKESCRKSGCGEICSKIICLGKKVL